MSSDPFATFTYDLQALEAETGFVMGHALSFKCLVASGDKFDLTSYRLFFSHMIVTFLRAHGYVADASPPLDVQARLLNNTAGLPSEPRLLFDCKVRVLPHTLPALFQDKPYCYVPIPSFGTVFVQRADVDLPKDHVFVSLSGVPITLADATPLGGLLQKHPCLQANSIRDLAPRSQSDLCSWTCKALLKPGISVPSDAKPMGIQLTRPDGAPIRFSLRLRASFPPLPLLSAETLVQAYVSAQQQAVQVAKGAAKDPSNQDELARLIPAVLLQLPSPKPPQQSQPKKRKLPNSAPATAAGNPSARAPVLPKPADPALPPPSSVQVLHPNRFAALADLSTGHSPEAPALGPGQ